MVFNFFLNTNLMIKNVPTNNEKIIKDLKSKVKEDKELYPIFFKKIINPVEIIKEMIIGLTPFKKALNIGLLVKCFKILAIRIIIIKEGRITPIVAQTAPKNPA